MTLRELVKVLSIGSAIGVALSAAFLVWGVPLMLAILPFVREALGHDP